MIGKQHRERYFVEPELQFWFILILILIVSVEGVFIGYGISRLLDIASDWQRPHMAMDFFKTLSLILFFLIVVNFILGTYLSHKIAGPLFRIRGVLRGIREGDLSRIFHPRPGDVLKDFFREFNETILVLNKLVNRDRKLLKQALAKLDGCIEILNKKHSGAEFKEIQGKLVEIKSFLVAVNSHFTSSPYTPREEKNGGKENNPNS